MSESSDAILTVTLSEFDDHGTTRARVGNRWVEVEHGIPGEIVKIELMGSKRQRGRIVDLVKSASDRVFPPCEYYREWKCGGCQWQHLSYRSQLRRKRRGVEATMKRAGLDEQVTATFSLSEPWRYRSTAGIALGKHAGFRRHGSLAIVPIEDCPISHPLIGELMAILNQRLEAGELPDFRGRVRLDVRLADGPVLQVLVKAADDHPPAPSDLEILTELLTHNEQIASVSIMSLDGKLVVLSGDPFGQTTVAGRPVYLHAGSFFQTNLELLPELIGRLQQEAAPLEGKRIADVYGGVGVFGLFLAEHASDVLVVESDPLAEEACRRTAASWGLQNVRFRAEEAESALKDASGFDVVIVDPPRTGLSETVIEALIEQQPDTILYISCLAHSLARDLRVLTAEGYTVEHLEVFDFYPQTYHVEILTVLRKTEDGASGTEAEPVYSRET
jgi:23S rRNA (uracil1939-C5)-methyltransferase